MRELSEQPDSGPRAGGLPTVVDIPSESGVRRSLHIVEIVNLIALGRDGEVPAKLDWLIQEMEAPGRFVPLNFEGLRRHVEKNERLPHRSWLRQFLDSLKKESYVDGYKTLRKARDDFKPTSRS
jgi:hypothetical protein